MTPYHPAHSTAVAGLVHIKGGDNRFYNNILVAEGKSSADGGTPPGKNNQRVAGVGLWVYDIREFPLQTGGNVYYGGAKPYSREVNPLTVSGSDPAVKVMEEGGRVLIHTSAGPEIRQAGARFVTTELLGKAKIPGLHYENPDGSPLKVDTDYFGKRRDPDKADGRMGIGMSVTSLDNTLIVHAIGAPIFFAIGSLVYFRKFNFTTPLQTATIFIVFVIAMDLFVVAMLINRSFEMFTSLLGTWIPFALIFTSTYLIGLRTRKPLVHGIR